MLNLPQIEKTAIKILKKGRKKSDGSPKDIDHTLRVKEKALEIANLIDQKTDKEIVAASALLHDIGWSFIDFQDQVWTIGAHAGAGSYKAFEISLANGAAINQALLIQKTISIHDFDVTWEKHERELEIVEKFLETIKPETYCLIAADKGDRFTNIQPYLDLFDLNNSELMKSKLQRLLNLSDLWFKNEKIKSLYQEGIDKVKQKLNSLE